MLLLLLQLLTAGQAAPALVFLSSGVSYPYARVIVRPKGILQVNVFEEPAADNTPVSIYMPQEHISLVSASVVEDPRTNT